MTEARLLIIGCGDLGLRVGQLLRHEHWQVDACRRNPPQNTETFNWHAADYTRQTDLQFIRALEPDYVLATFTPISRDEQGYRAGFSQAARNLLWALGEHRLRRLLMVSSTRVYGESGGGWVDEASPLSTSDNRAKAIITAEKQLLDSIQPTTIVRAAGIYGAPGGRLMRKVSGGQIAPQVPECFTNRIHREDCAGFLAHLLAMAQQGEHLEAVYNAVDDRPCPAHEIESWLAGKLQIPATEQPAGGGGVSHKRCANGALKASGYVLRYPDYRSGYTPLLNI